MFDRLSGGELEKLEKLTRRQRFRAHTAVFFQDDPSDSLYVMLTGSAKVFPRSRSRSGRTRSRLADARYSSKG